MFKLNSPNAEGNNGSAQIVEVDVSSLSAAKWTEKDLENLLAKRIELVVPEDDLMVISQEIAYREMADILALDESGTLHIFELKRWSANQENLLQVMRYGQIFGQYKYDQLELMFRGYLRDRKKEGAGVDLRMRHQEYFGLVAPLAKETFNLHQRFILVTAGTDTPTLQAAQFWKEKGLPIEVQPYHVFRHGNDHFVLFANAVNANEQAADANNGNFIVNTCATYYPLAYREMLKEEKAAAYTDRKNAVNPIRPGNRVFLYHTGIGIIAAGRALKPAQKKDFGGDPAGEHYVPLQFDFLANPDTDRDRCIPAWEINKRAETSHKFRQTAFRISNGLSKTIEDLIQDRRTESPIKVSATS